MFGIMFLLFATVNIPTIIRPQSAQATIPHGSRQSEAAQAKAVLAYLDDTCQAAHSLRYKANVTVSIKELPDGPIWNDRYAVTGVFQQPVYARIDEVQDGKTVLTLVSNPEHLYLYSPVTNAFQDDGNVPVYFAIWDMLMAQGAGSDQLAPTSRRLGYYFDITGFSGRNYAGDSPWPADHGSSGTGNLSVTTTSLNGRIVEVLASIARGSGDVTTWKVFLDPKTGLPLRATMTGVGPSLEDATMKGEQIKFQEDYVSFKPSQAVIPESVFEFVPPPLATRRP